MNNDYTILSSKNNLVLLRNKNKKSCYRLQFNVLTDKFIEIKKFINFDIYKELYELNTDIIDEIKIEKIENEPNSILMIMQIKPIANSLGIKGKYVVTKVNMICPENKNCVGFIASSIPISQTNFKAKEDYEELIYKDSNLFTFWDEKSKSIIIQYDFTVIDPLYEKMNMEIPDVINNTGALIIKKLFIRIKEYKEIQLKRL